MKINVSENYEAWSYINLKKGLVGEWSVSVLDDQKNILAKKEFIIEPYKE